MSSTKSFSHMLVFQLMLQHSVKRTAVILSSGNGVVRCDLASHPPSGPSAVLRSLTCQQLQNQSYAYSSRINHVQNVDVHTLAQPRSCPSSKVPWLLFCIIIGLVSFSLHYKNPTAAAVYKRIPIKPALQEHLARVMSRQFLELEHKNQYQIIIHWTKSSAACLTRWWSKHRV